MRRILIIGSWGTTHIRRFLRILCENKDECLIIDSFDPRVDENQGNECNVNNVYRVKVFPLQNKLYSIRKVGTYFFMKKKVNTFDQLLSDNHYDLVNIHFLPADTEEYVKVAHKHGVKIMLTPLGSDVLRLNKIYMQSMKRAFAKADYVSANFITGFCSKVKDMFSISNEKMVNLGYGSETLTSIIEIKGKYSREQLCKKLNIPCSPYIICCGYNASKAQHHEAIIDAINANRNLLPDGFRLLFPLSYGPNKAELPELIKMHCEQLGLPYILLTDFLSVEQVAALRFITDLFIHVQTTDAYSASIQEFLLADTEVINGSWLSYPSLESHGLPYHVIESIDGLPAMINCILKGNEPKPFLSAKAEYEIRSNAWSERIKSWIDAYTYLKN